MIWLVTLPNGLPMYIAPIIDDEKSDFNYYRGNVYMKHAIGEDGKQIVVTPESIKYDTFS